MKLSKKLNTFYELFIAFQEQTSNSPNADENDELHCSSNSGNIDSEKRGYVSV